MNPHSNGTVVTRILALGRQHGGALAATLQSLGLRVAGMACTLGLGVILARALGPSDYGIYGLVISLASLAMNVILFGTPQLAVREFAIGSRIGAWSEVARLSRSFRNVVGLSGLALLVLALLWYPTGNSIVGLNPDNLLFAAGLAFLLAITALYSAGLRGAGQMSRGQFMDILGRPAAVFLVSAAVLLSYGGISVATALWIQLAAAALGAAICWWWFGRAIRQPDDSARKLIGAWAGVALPLAVIDILRQLDGTYALLMMGWFSPGEELGLFRVALACVAIVNMPIAIIHIVFAPSIAQLRHSGERDELQALLDRVSISMTAVSAAFAFGILLLGKPVIIFAFGEAYAGSWLPLAIMAFAQLSFALFGMGPILLAMAGEERTLTAIYIAAVGAGIVAAAVLLERFGGAGAAMAQFVSLTTVAALTDWIAVRRLGVHTSWIRWPWGSND